MPMRLNAAAWRIRERRTGVEATAWHPYSAAATWAFSAREAVRTSAGDDPSPSASRTGPGGGLVHPLSPSVLNGIRQAIEVTAAFETLERSFGQNLPSPMGRKAGQPFGLAWIHPRGREGSRMNIASQFVRLTRAADEYVQGDVDALLEIIIYRQLRIFAMLPDVKVVIPPREHRTRPTHEQAMEWPQWGIHGWWPVIGHGSRTLLSIGTAKVNPVSMGTWSTGEPKVGWLIDPQTMKPTDIVLDWATTWLLREEVERNLDAVGLPAIGPPSQEQGQAPDGEALGSRERNSLLRIIAALAKQAKIDLTMGTGAAAAIEAALNEAGFDSPKERTIREVLSRIRAIE